MENTALLDQIKVVAKTRQRAKGMSDHRKAMYDEFISKHTEFFADVVVAATAVSEAETILRELTLKVFAFNGNKAPGPGVGIREVTKYAYDGGEALKWAREHKMALKLDETKFKNHVKPAPPDFVKVPTEAQATIATDLEAALAGD